MVMYNEDANYIHAEALADRSGPQYVQAYQRAYDFFTERGFKPQFEKLDNEAPRALDAFCKAHGVQLERAPPHMHRTNKAERAIRTFKNHMIASLSSTSPVFRWLHGMLSSHKSR